MPCDSLIRLTLTTAMSRNGHVVFRCKLRCCCCLFRFHYAIKRCEICERRDVTRDFYAIIRCRRKYENILFSTATSLNRIKIRGNICHFMRLTDVCTSNFFFISFFFEIFFLTKSVF